MIVVDTSALMAVALNEAKAEDCKRALDAADEILISAGTLTEALIVSARRNVRRSVELLVDGLSFTVVDVTPYSARLATDSYDLWGKGVHPAALNLGDCFAHEVARSNNCPLLFVGDDSALTDVESILPRPAPV